MIKFVGELFGIKEPWGKQEKYIVDSIMDQIKIKYKNQNNLVVNLTWLGPQHNHESWKELIQLNGDFDNMFWIGAVDPLSITLTKLKEIENKINPKNIFYMGCCFDQGPYTFNTGAIACYEDTPKYELDDIKMTKPKFTYMCYNRKPKKHRILLVESLVKNNLKENGILTLGKNNTNYDVSEGEKTDLFFKLDNDEPEDYFREKNYYDFGGVPFDLYTLGNLELWKNHFLNIISETEYKPWDPMFVTEKTWKPIIGLRPFIINGQPQIYSWLRKNGFKTFNHYFPVDVENVNEEQIVDRITEVVKYFARKSENEIVTLYNSMYNDLLHNRKRFYEFALEQKNKVENIFT